MRFAQKEGKRILPNPLEKDAFCPLCNNPVLGKCGDIKIWHWAHKNLCECDSFAEPETEWHLNWKDNFPTDCQEVIINHHRADVKIKDIVIEFQNSIISSEQIIERESFYGQMKWMINGETLGKNITLFDKGDYITFKWKWFPKAWSYSARPIYVDLSYMRIVLIKEIGEYSGDKKHYSTVKECTYDWEDDYGNIREGDYQHYYSSSYEDTERYLEHLRKRLDKLMEKDIFLIKKLSDNGTGWGKLMSKQNFIRGCYDGYYRN